MSAGTRALEWANWSTRFLLFTGKGGVGKTTVASAVAIALADAGSQVLLVSTDPASNLHDVFQTPTGEDPSPAPGVTGLDLMDLDPETAAKDYKERLLTPYRGKVPAAEFAAIAEQLEGACTLEVATFDVFSRLLADRETTEHHDHVVFDTAPTGHTLRLLELPAAWSHYLAVTPEETSCVGPLAGLQGQRPVYEQAVSVLGDPASTTLVLVARPDRAALTEAARTGAELGEQGLTNQRLVVNGFLSDPFVGDPVAESYAHHQRQSLAQMPESLGRLEIATVPLVPYNLVGVDALRRLAVGGGGAVSLSPNGQHAPDLPRVDDLVDEIAAAGPGVTLVTGKGGVGKTSIAVRISAGLASRGLPVHLATTDPAGRLPVPGGGSLPAKVTVSRVDPEAETKRYAAEQKRAGPQEQQQLQEEDLRSPCTTEVAVFIAFGRLLALGRTQHVVIDTAPTGHTLLLLDVTGAFHRQVMRDVPRALGRLITPLMRLQDARYSRLLIVALPETTPVAEAADLQADVRRAGIEPFGWVLNACLSSVETSDPVLGARARLELPQIERVVQLAKRVWLAPYDPLQEESDMSLSPAATTPTTANYS